MLIAKKINNNILMFLQLSVIKNVIVIVMFIIFFSPTLAMLRRLTGGF